MPPTLAERIREARRTTPTGAAPHVGMALAHAGALAATLAAWLHGSWGGTVLGWLALTWLGHAALTRLHESVHGTLSRSRLWNELGGLAIGTFALTPVSVYRHVHARHHARLGGPDDPEFVPYNRLDASRARRIGYATAELLAGWIVTPALYGWRTCRAWAAHRPAVRRRLVLEYAALAAFWGTVVGCAAAFAAWDVLIVGHVVPAWLTGSVQTVRKFVEHLGLHGDTVFAMTRSVRYSGPVGRFASWTQCHVDLHAVHHRWPRIPWRALPALAPHLARSDPDARFASSHGPPLAAAARALLDPKVGPQWRSRRAATLSRSAAADDLTEPHGVDRSRAVAADPR